MKTIRREDLNKTLLAAVVGALVALLVSPFTQSLSFLVNEYLARPILSIEYVEIVPEEQATSFPAKEVQALLSSPGFRSALMHGIGTDPGLMAFQGRTEEATVTELQALKGGIERLLVTLEKRCTELGAFREVLTSGASEARAREVAAKYQGPMVAVIPVKDIESLTASLLAAIETESTALRETIDLGKPLLDKLSEASDHQAHNIKLKLSVLNRGSTDGLVRHTGEIRVPAANLTVNIRRSSPPAKPGGQGLFAMAVPVAVTNPAPDTERTTSVGKVEKNSMSEFWMEIDDAATPKESVKALLALTAGGKPSELVVILSDHRNRKIERSVVLPGK